MGRRNDNTGVANTCPLIDEVLNFISGIGCEDDETGLKKAHAETILEKIRSMNSELRDFGNKQHEELYQMEKEKDYYEKRCHDLEKDLECALDDYRELEKQFDRQE